MIVVRLYGGLGNQMFQYATAYAIATRLKIPLFFDACSYKKDRLRFLELLCFPVIGKTATEDQILKLAPKWWRKISSYKIRTFVGRNLLRNSIVTEKREFSCDPTVQNLQRSCYLDGYWQNPEYFDRYRSDLLQIFMFPAELNNKFSELTISMKKESSVALHVRMGDYLGSIAIKNKHGVLPIEYYIRALNEVSKKLVRPCVYLFSDAPKEAHNVIAAICSDPLRRISGKYTHSPFEDMFLMSMCQNHIIANSTFSWWAAWLSRNARKIVYAPKNWLANSKVSTSGIFPKDWLII